MEKTKITCVVCPNGCEITVGYEIENGKKVFKQADGNKCDRGKEYSENELICPVRTLTSTVKLIDGMTARLAVKSAQPVPKASIMECMKEIRKAKVESPVFMGDVIIPNVAGTGISIIAEKNG